MKQLIRLYLQFTDASELLRHWEVARTELESSSGGSFLSLFSSRAFEFARALLFLFHAAHLVVLYHPNHAFDLAYLRLFKASHSLLVVSFLYRINICPNAQCRVG